MEVSGSDNRLRAGRHTLGPTWLGSGHIIVVGTTYPTPRRTPCLIPPSSSSSTGPSTRAPFSGFAGVIRELGGPATRRSPRRTRCEASPQHPSIINNIVRPSTLGTNRSPNLTEDMAAPTATNSNSVRSSQSKPPSYNNNNQQNHIAPIVKAVALVASNDNSVTIIHGSITQSAPHNF